MSSMWDVAVNNRGGNWVDFDVSLAHPDAGAVPRSKGFALQLMLKPAYRFDDNYHYVAAGPLGEQVASDNFWDAEQALAIADRFVAKVEVLEATGGRFDEEAAHAKVDAAVVAQGLSKEDAGWESAWDEHWRDFWCVRANLISATLRVTVTDPAWIAHLKPGLSFDTAAWCPKGPYIRNAVANDSSLPEDAEVSAMLAPFPLSWQPRGSREMNAELIRSLAASGDPLAGETLAHALSKHQAFLDSGGEGGSWQPLSAAGMPLCIYQGPKGTEGEQLVLRMKAVPPSESLEERTLRYADLSGALCEGVRFARARLDGSIAIDGFFDGADFSGASLKGVDFSGSSLRGCNFGGADLSGADFEHTDCTGADFTGARLTGSRFPGAILDECRAP